MGPCRLSCVIALVGVVGMARPDRAAETRTPPPPAPSGTSAAADYAPFMRLFLAQRPDRAQVAHVRHLVLERGSTRLTLERGDLALCTPVEGRVCGAVFTGEGVFSITPPTAFERRELLRFMKACPLERRIGALVLIFADRTGEELARQLTFAKSTLPAEASAHLEDCLGALGDPVPLDLDPGLARPFLDGVSSDYFFAYVVGIGGERMFFEIDPSQYEDETFWRTVRGPFVTPETLRKREVVCQYPRGGRYDTLAVGSTRPSLEAKSIRLDCHIATGLGFSAVADLRCRAARDGDRWIPFTVYEGLDVDSVAWDGIRVTSVFRRRGSPMLWVRAETPIARGEEHSIRVSYHGDLIESIGDWLMLRSTGGWFPRPLGNTEATFDLTFHSPAQFHLASVGEQVLEETRDKVATTTWAVRRPTGNVTFVLGRFEEESFGSDSTPPIHALMFQGKPGRIVARVGGLSVVQGTMIKQWVAEDVARCVAFYQKLFGPAQVPSLMIVQIPGFVGEAFPGLINIPETMFIGPMAGAEDQCFRSHEVAHQWWGYGVDGRTFHDHWLTEGFANFAALWYLQAGLGRSKDYLAVLGKWREDLLDDLHTRPEHGRQAGPIWLGARNASRSRPADYRLVDYKKGAWVLHMLRGFLLDLETMDDGRFVRLMQDFYRTYAGGFASTEDFRRVAERHAGQDLGWFFDEWVYGVGIPSYRFATKSERMPDGKYRVKCRVEQTGVPAEFRMPVTLRVEFGNEQFAWVRREITGPVAEFELPLMPKAPTRVVLNDIESVLCEVKEVGW